MIEVPIVNNRYQWKCRVSYKGVDAYIPFLVDTGACFSTCSSVFLNPYWKESDFAGMDYTFFGGYTNKTLQSKHYRYHLDKFAVGNIKLESRDIWVTFDPNIDINLLGMDILQDISFLQIAKAGKLVFFKDKE